MDGASPIRILSTSPTTAILGHFRPKMQQMEIIYIVTIRNRV